MAKRIVLFSTKGGVGKSLIATNLAVSMSKNQMKRVCLVDFDLQAIGDMARMLNINPQRAIVDLMGILKRQVANFKLEDFLVHTEFGVDLLAGVLKPQQSPHLDPLYIKDILGDLLDKNYDYIIIDAGKNFSEVFLAILNQANLILLVITPDILSVYQTKWTLDTLQFLQFPLSMVKIVLNRAESAASIGWQEVSAALPCDIIARIPSEGKVVGLAVNQGIPVVINNPRAKVSQAIIKFAEYLEITQNLFVEIKEIDQLRPKEAAIAEKSGEFWLKEGLVEPLQEYIPTEEVDEILLLKRRIHKRLIDELNLKRLDLKVFSNLKKTKELKDRAEIMISNFLAEESGGFISSPEVRKKLVKEILDEALGLGPLEDLLADPTITDIMVNNKDEVYIERNGKLELTSKKFISNEQVKVIIERIIAPIGRRIDESVPMVDARLPDGSRVNAIIPPLSLTGPTLTIRKFRKEKFKCEELVKINTLSVEMAEFLKACVLARKNIIISGGTGSGKTTVLNVLSEFIPDSERIVTIEDAAELKLHQEHWVRLESRPPNIEGKGAITVRDLFRNTLRMRPDRIIIGECRGVETLDMLQAMNTGHDGSMTTIHANSTHDVLVRLDSMILMSGVELPIRAIREMVASTIDLIVHTARLSDGTRKIVQITELAGIRDEINVNLQDIFIFRQTGIDNKGNILGNFRATGYKPSFLEDLRIKGIFLPDNLFTPSP
ncbi:MAG: Flp pilus assembly complex ATPase component TadA [Candidatus Omnitrophica bacterium]|nr:Flp pilus assembly complex ATPase component TadA [Candidatus Omnitrophota bacterium]